MLQLMLMKRKINEISDALFALTGLANMGVVIGLPFVDGFTFNNLYGLFFWLSLMNSVMYGRWVLSKKDVVIK